MASRNFSLNSLREDLSVSHQTLARWVDLLESFYYCFRIFPYNTSVIKSLRKEPKLYLWDYSELTDLSVKFENLVASHLLKFVHYLYDAFGLRIELKYLRDIDQREVDFVITVDNDPIFLVETKLGDQKISTSQKYFTKKLSASNSYQVVLEEGIDYYSSRYGSRVLSASKFLSGLI